MTPTTTPAETIQMVDLKNQYLRMKPAVDAALQECLNETAFIKGPQVARFEQALGNYLGGGQVVSCGNGTDALQLSLMALGLRPGDEVIVPSFTYVATAEAAALLGLVPVMVDVDPGTFTVTAAHVADGLSDKTKAVVPVHLFGQCADMEAINELCRAHGLYVIEDNAQAIGSRYGFSDGASVPSGMLGDLGATSFFPTKNLGGYGDGGAVTTSDRDRADRIRRIANHGQSRKYVHETVGINSRLDTLQAAVLLEKLKYLDAFNAARQRAARWYDEGLSGLDRVEVPRRAPYSTHVFNQYTLKVPPEDRDPLRDYLRQRGVPSMVYYPIPLSEQNAYRGSCRVAGDLPVTKELCRRVLSLPMHSELTESQASYVCETVRGYFGEGRQAAKYHSAENLQA